MLLSETGVVVDEVVGELSHRVTPGRYGGRKSGGLLDWRRLESISA